MAWRGLPVGTHVWGRAVGSGMVPPAPCQLEGEGRGLINP